MTNIPVSRALIRILPCLLAALIISVAFHGPAIAADSDPKAVTPDVFVLHSYHQGSPRTDGLMRGIAGAFEKEGGASLSMPVYLEADRLGARPDYKRLLESTTTTISVMFEAIHPKVVLVTDWTALRFWKEHRGQIAPDVPVVYCGIGDPPPAWASDMARSIGVVEKLAIAGTIEAAMHLVPKANKLLVLETTAPYFDVVRKQLDKELAAFSGKIEIHRFTNQDISAIEHKLAELDKSWIVLAVGRPEQDGIKLVSSAAASRLSKASPVPVFATWRTWVGHGVVGGKVMSSENQGHKAGETALAIMRGVPVEELPRLQQDAGSFLFDHIVLRRFGLSEERLPPGSKVLNKPVSFYEANTQLVWIYGLITVLLFVITGALSLYIAFRRQTQNQLAAQVNFVESLMEAMPTPVFYKDVEGVYLGCNKAMESFIGISKGRLVGHTVHELYPPNEANVFKRQDDALFAAGPVQIYEFEKSTPDGPRQIRFHKALYYDAAGSIAGLVGVIADITDLRNAEQEVQTTRNYLQAIIDSAPQAIFSVDGDGVITHANAMAREEWGANPGGSFTQAAPSLEQVLIHVRQAIAEGRPQHLPRQVGMEDGKLKARDIMVYPLVSVGLAEAVVSVEDATQRHRMEEMLVQSEKMMSVGGLAAGMAHEINNPLGGIMQSAQVIQTRIRVDLPANIKAAGQAGVPMEGVRTYLELRDIPPLLDGLRDAAKRAAAIVANMLEFSKRHVSAWLPEEVNPLVDKALDLCLQDYNLAENYDFKRIAIVKEYDSANPSVPCSSQQIQQVVFNLLRNAAQAMFLAETPGPMITLATRREGDCIIIEVRDNGPGMDESTRRKVFEPFFTTKEPGMGTGLGLSVSYFIVKENHGGDIEVESEPGKGARFLVSLPLRNRQCIPHLS